jgi:hypothetical protein
VLFPREGGSQFEGIYFAAQRWPRLQEHYSGVLKGIKLDSPEASSMRSHLEFEQKLAARYQQPPALEVELSGQILECLNRAEAGDWQAWWQLNAVLARSPEDPDVINDFDYIITGMPGWVSTDKATRERIVAGAAVYLSVAESQVDSWLGRQPISPKGSDLAALRALLLLRQVDCGGTQ